MTEICLTNHIYHLKRENNARRQHATTFSCLGKLGAVSGSDLHRWGNFFNNLLKNILSPSYDSVYPMRPLIIGLAESGIIPSALVHLMLRKQGIHADWICSTRRPAQGIVFTESHSHAPDHILPIPCHQPDELWFVEDEITTGRTVLHLALKLCRLMNIRRVRFLSIADIRSHLHKKRFQATLKLHGIGYSLHTLIRLEPEKQDFQALFYNKGRNTASLADENTFQKRQRLGSHKYSEKNWHIPQQRPAIRNQSDYFADVSNMLLASSDKIGKGCLLVVGEAIDIALKMVQANPQLSFSHITLSPWQMDGNHILSRLDICGKYYLYNYHNLKSPLYILNDPIDAHIGAEAKRLLSEKGFSVEELVIGY